MIFPSTFICAGPDFATFDRFVPAPYFRKTFPVTDKNSPASLLITGLGFYRLWINGREITKGLLAPYISSPDDLVYFDEYDLSPYLLEGANVLCVQLGNGLQNSVGGGVWDFDLARWRGAPRLAFRLSVGEDVFEADAGVRTAPSGLYFDDMRCGARFDARLEPLGWEQPGFDDSDWKYAVVCEPPRGEYRLCGAPPIRVYKELSPVSVRFGGICDYTPTNGKVPVPDPANDPCIAEREGFIYDFGENNAGTVRLRIKGRPGQRVELQYGEALLDGKLDYQDIQFYPEYYGQRDVYICRGGEEEVFEPPFTYHGFRYCAVLGIDESQAAPELLTFLVASSEQETVGSFDCDDETLNTLYRMCEVSDRANFYYFPTDCPQREKNGWTGDAQLSAEHMLMTIDCAGSLAEWLRSIRKAQREDGCLPGIVPTNDWGWDCGPSWDAVITELPYQIRRFTGDEAVLRDNAGAIMRYLFYGASKRDERGLMPEGLGDWCCIGGDRKSNEFFTRTLAFMDSAVKAGKIFDALDMPQARDYARSLAASLKDALRREFVGNGPNVVDTGCQTSLAMAIYYGLLDPDGEAAAKKKLVSVIHEGGDFMDVGILGARAIFRVLADMGEIDLALKIMTRHDFPSYGHFIERGFTAVPEAFELPENRNYSLNHHMFCDIKGFFIASLAGLRYRPDDREETVLFAPRVPVNGPTRASAWFRAPEGMIRCAWRRTGDGLKYEIECPEGVSYAVDLPPEYADRAVVLKK